MWNEADYATKMDKALEAFSRELSSLRTGRASQNFLDPVQVDAYGSKMGLSHVATISVLDARTLSINVWDQGMVSAVEKGIMESNLGLNPQTEGAVIRITLPELNEERRRELVKVAGKYAENGRIAIRNIRREGMDNLKKMEKSSDISEDEMHRNGDKLQKLTDDFVSKIDKAFADKEKDMLQI
ncbi:MAG: ribosome recycling factor [Alphaproteobacteria bacterium]|nr:ribosome recycling factor [Alphaproteobacteria bacterium]